MRELYEVVKVLWLGFIVLFCSYQITMALFGIRRRRELPPKVVKMHRFAAIVCARNEQAVIDRLINSLKKQQYPQQLLDIYVVADNCTDQTAQVARDAGAIVYERFNNEQKGKGYALHWIFNILLRDKADAYDAYFVFDADNVVKSDFTEKMNWKLCHGAEVVQGYRDIKNPSDSWVSGNYALFYWSQNRLYSLPRVKMGLNCMLNGTGFMVRADVLQQSGGWCTQTITEDIEFSLRNIADGRDIDLCYDAIVYDEQPITFRQSWDQRLRWAVGNLQCTRLMLGRMCKRALKGSLKAIDACIFMIGMPMLFVSLVMVLLDTIFISGNGAAWLAQWQIVQYFMPTLQFLGTMYIAPMAQAVATVLLEKKPLKSVWKGIATYPVFIISWAFINFTALFVRRPQWKPIPHVRAVDVEDIQKEHSA
nr:glycosyltransferase family 2 protein [Maliibacterium massiliense]